jgi:transposase
MLADALGRPLRFRLAPGQQHDLIQAPAMIEGFRAKAVIADTAYDSRAFREDIDAISAEPVIPSNTPSTTTSANTSSGNASSAASTSSSTSDASPPDTTGETQTSSPSSTLQPQ